MIPAGQISNCNSRLSFVISGEEEELYLDIAKIRKNFETTKLFTDYFHLKAKNFFMKSGTPSLHGEEAV